MTLKPTTKIYSTYPIINEETITWQSVTALYKMSNLTGYPSKLANKQSRTVARYQKFKRTSQIYERTHAPIGEKNKNGEVKE